MVESMKKRFDSNSQQVLQTDETINRKDSILSSKTQNKTIRIQADSIVDPQSLVIIENDIKVLNHCFDDIENFVSRIQESKIKRIENLSSSDSSLSISGKLTSKNDLLDIFQKFKLSLNLLANLNDTTPNLDAPKLLHNIFKELYLLVNITKHRPYSSLPKTVWLPLLTKKCKEFLQNCLISKEMDLWKSLGDAWYLTVEEARLQPQLYGHLDNQVYLPRFSNGWTPVQIKETLIDSSSKIKAQEILANSSEIETQEILTDSSEIKVNEIITNLSEIENLPENQDIKLITPEIDYTEPSSNYDQENLKVEDKQFLSEPNESTFEAPLSNVAEQSNENSQKNDLTQTELETTSQMLNPISTNSLTLTQTHNEGFNMPHNEGFYHLVLII